MVCFFFKIIRRVTDKLTVKHVTFKCTSFNACRCEMGYKNPLMFIVGKVIHDWFSVTLMLPRCFRYFLLVSKSYNNRVSWLNSRHHVTTLTYTVVISLRRRRSVQTRGLCLDKSWLMTRIAWPWMDSLVRNVLWIAIKYLIARPTI